MALMVAMGFRVMVHSATTAMAAHGEASPVVVMAEVRVAVKAERVALRAGYAAAVWEAGERGEAKVGAATAAAMGVAHTAVGVAAAVSKVAVETEAAIAERDLVGVCLAEEGVRLEVEDRVEEAMVAVGAAAMVAAMVVVATALATVEETQVAVTEEGLRGAVASGEGQVDLRVSAGLAEPAVAACKAQSRQQTASCDQCNLGYLTLR